MLNVQYQIDMQHFVMNIHIQSTDELIAMTGIKESTEDKSKGTIHTAAAMLEQLMDLLQQYSGVLIIE